MAQTGYTPIQLYYSSTTTNAPTAGNLAYGELAINITDGKLFYKDNANAVQVISWKTTPTSAGGTGLTSYTAGDTLYYASGTALSKLSIGTTDYVMTSSGSAPQWSASLKAKAGGTGQTSYAVGDLLYADTTTTLAKLADVATGNALISGGVGVAPAWGKIALTTHVSGVLPTANGGTNLSSFTANGVVYASSTSALATGSAFVFDGTTGNLGLGTTSPNISGGASGSQVITISASASGRNALLELKGTRTSADQVSSYIRSFSNSGATPGVDLQFYRGATDTDGYLTISTSGTEAARIDSSGNFYIEVAATTASAANMFLDTTTTPSGQVKRSTSALKYKQDIRELEEYDISTFRPVRYKSACDGDDQTVDHLGFIADWEDEAGHKELVSYGKDGEVEGFQYERMTAILTKVVQQQQAIIQSLTARITALEGK